MTPHVHLMPSAKRKLGVGLHDRVRAELARVFPQAVALSVYDVLAGFSEDQSRKVILAVEAEGAGNRFGRRFERHIVKLGQIGDVASDVSGWETCIASRQMSERMFVPVRLCGSIGDDGRAAAVYQDAGQWYGLLTPNEEEVGTLAWAVDRAVFHQDIDLASVERLIRQVFRELGRSLYRDAVEAPEPARAFYRWKLQLDAARPIANRWREGDLRTMRRDVDWLLCGFLSPVSPALPAYVDPYDYVLWALDGGEIPPTLVGAAHGDFHASNALVGVSRGEVEYPLIIDYGSMTAGNVIAWDFAKLESEIKVRLMTRLFAHRETREAVWEQVRHPHLERLVRRWGRPDSNAPPALVNRTQQIAFAFEFERWLHESAAPLHPALGSALEARPASSRPLDRALSILQTIRLQAAEQLGRASRNSDCWKDEWNFALGVYGLNTVKYAAASCPDSHRLFSLVAAGKAIARIGSVRDALHRSTVDASSAADDSPIYHIPLRRAYHLWRADNDLEHAEQLLGSISARFEYSVVLGREYALLQAKVGKTAAAEATIRGILTPHGAPRTTESDLLTSCESFLEIELLCRLGRINKDKADACWERLEIEFRELEDHTVSHYYGSAFRAYRKAYELTKDYYPGGCAAVTGLLSGQEPSRIVELARNVSRECAALDFDSLAPTDRYWVLATEGEMCLLLGDGRKGADFFRTALEELPAGNDGMIQTTYHQLCRLHRALEGSAMAPVLRVFQQTDKFKLRPGPLGDCAGLFAGRAG